MVTIMAQGLQYSPPSARQIACPINFGSSGAGPPPTMRNHNRLFFRLALAFLGVLVLFHPGASAQAAEPAHSGTYRCVSVEVAGKTKHCKAPSLEMNSDGSYQILSEHGTYEILRGHWLVLSASKNRGRARLDGNNKQIIFEFV